MTDVECIIGIVLMALALVVIPLVIFVGGCIKSWRAAHKPKVPGQEGEGRRDES